MHPHLCKRLRECSRLNVEQSELAESLRMSSSQRLLPRLCPACKSSAEPTPLLARMFQLPPEAVVFEEGACEQCSGWGELGSLAVYELLPIGKEMRSLLRRPSPVGMEALCHAASQQGQEPLGRAVRRSLLAGEVSPGSALRAMGVRPEIAGYRKGFNSRRSCDMIATQPNPSCNSPERENEIGNPCPSKP